MATLTITLDARTEAGLARLSKAEGTTPDEIAARLLRRALRPARPVWDAETLNAYAVENKNEEIALADSDSEHRAQILVEVSGLSI